jgi:large subunit ribosomal protein L9
MQAKLQEERQKQASVDKKEAEEQASSIQELTVSTTVKVDHDGHMYGSVSSIDIVELLKDQAGIELERRSIQLPHAIKEIGIHNIKVKLKEGVLATFVLKVIPEEGTLKEEAKKTKEAKEDKDEG